MQTRHWLAVGLSALAALLPPQIARASWLRSLVCDGLETNPIYWQIYGAVEAARSAGVLTSKDDCQLGGTSASDIGNALPAGLPTGAITDCVCSSVFGDAPPSRPICPIAHNVCTEGSQLPADVSLPTYCVPSGSAIIAAAVCTFDPYCCTTFWDRSCVEEVTQSYWNKNASQAIEWSIEDRPYCSVNEGNAPMSDEAIKQYEAECPNNRTTTQSGLSAGWNLANQAAAEVRASDALCLGSAPAQLYAAGEFADGNYDFSGYSSDWDYGFYKGQCAAGFAQLGLSYNYFQGSDGLPYSYPHGILCGLASLDVFTGKYTATLSMPGDHRRASRLGDWDRGFDKLECGINEYVYGVSQDPTWRAIQSVACAASTGLSNRGCHAVPFDSGLQAGDGDWDVGFYKSECATNEYVAGVSVASDTYTPSKLLCCLR